MSVVYKVTLPPPGVSDMIVSAPSMPCDAEPLHVAFQGDNLCLWFVTSEHPVSNIIEHVEHRFLIEGTGFHFDPAHGDADRMRMRYVGTAHHPTGLVFHVFDLDGDT